VDADIGRGAGYKRALCEDVDEEREDPPFIEEVFRPRGFIFDDVFVKWPQLPKATALSLQADVISRPHAEFPPRMHPGTTDNFNFRSSVISTAKDRSKC
jgi:hypothetical protein